MAEEKKEAKQEVTEQKTAERAEQTTDQSEQTGPEKQEYREITIKFGKGCCKDPFTAKDGKSYVEICIPNTDPEDHTPWASFVLPQNHVHENQYGKGLWAKLPENGKSRNLRFLVGCGVKPHTFPFSLSFLSYSLHSNV